MKKPGARPASVSRRFFAGRLLLKRPSTAGKGDVGEKGGSENRMSEKPRQAADGGTSL